MQLEEYFDFHKEPVESIRIKGTRINIDFVIDLYKRHMTPEQIAVHFGCPLDPVQVYAAITYYLANRQSVEEYLERGERRFREVMEAEKRKPTSPVVERIRELKRRFSDVDGRIDMVALRKYLDEQATVAAAAT